jgi:endoglucanase
VLVTKLAPSGQLNNNREAYLTFNAASVSGTISAVTLRVYGRTEDDRDANVPVALYAVSNTGWSESTITWNNKPATGSSALATATVTDETGRYYTWNVTSYVQSEIAAGRPVVSFVLKNPQTTDGRLLWNSKETGSNAPQLAVTTTTTLQSQKQLSQTPAEEEAKEMTLMAWPNPFRQNNTITFQLAAESYTHLAAYDITGKQVSVLVSGRLAAGPHRVYFKPDAMPAGIYLLRLISNGKTVTRKLIKE